MSSGECRLFSIDLSNHMERAWPLVLIFTYIPTDKEFGGEISEIRPVEKVQDPTVIDSKTVYQP